MKKLTKIISIILIITSILSIAGCVNERFKDNVQRYAWPLGTASPEDTITQIYGEKFAEEVYRLSHGKMRIQVYPNSILGGDRELLESCRDGDIPFVVQNTAPQVPFMPETSVFDIPSVFYSIDDARRAVDNEVFYSFMQDAYEKSGYKLLGYADQGFRVLSTNKKIESLEDFKAQKIRTMENSNHIYFWKLLGANPTPMTFSEVYIGLQQGTIDAQENPYDVIISSKLYEQQRYIVQTNHLPHFISLIVSDEFYNKLSTYEQDIITRAAEIAKEYARKIADQRINTRIGEIKESGADILDIPEELQLQIMEITKPVHENISRWIGNEIVDAYLQRN